jgi:YhgE/Pip-like protein
MTEPDGSRGSRRLGWKDPFRVPSVWLPPLVLVAVLILVMTLVYFGSVVNPAAHLHGLPVAVVNEDSGGHVGARRVDFGEQLAAGLIHSPAVASRLGLRPSTLSTAASQMGVGKEYAAIVIPSGFTGSLLTVAGVPTTSSGSTSKPTIELLTNPRAGTLGVSLATAVAQPALARASRQIGQRLSALSSALHARDAEHLLLEDPLTVASVPYRPLPSHSALGLSAFYIALLTTFCGFLGGVIVTTSVDAVLGYVTTEVGPVWRQRQPVEISRWHTLLAKWVMATALTVVLTGLMLATAVGILNMNAPHLGLLWLLTWFAATVVAIGTLVLFAALGTVGQIVALLVFVYLALASSGGTVPLDALSGFFKFLANFEPLRQILDGVRAILYFGARGEAGLTRAGLASGLGLVFWLAVGILVTTWYDRRHLYRMPPDLMAYVDRAVLAYRAQTREIGSRPAQGSQEVSSSADDDTPGESPLP